MSNWDTAANIINDAAIELGLISAPVADPFASTDINLAQLRAHLKSLGQDMVRDYQWTHLQRQWTLATQAGLDTYELPPDYNRFIDQTAWNRTQRMPLTGPVNAQGWQELQATTPTGTVNIVYRIVGNALRMYPPPQVADSIAYEYISANWVATDGEETPNVNTPIGQGDLLCFDRRLLVCGLKLRWKRGKGFDTAAEQDDYDRALARAQGGDGAAPVLNLNVQPFSGNRVLDAANLPDTGYGT